MEDAPSSLPSTTASCATSDREVEGVIRTSTTTSARRRRSAGWRSTASSSRRMHERLLSGRRLIMASLAKFSVVSRVKSLVSDNFLKRIPVGLPGSVTVNRQTYYFVVTRSRVDPDTRIYREDFKLLSEDTRARATGTTTSTSVLRKTKSRTSSRRSCASTSVESGSCLGRRRTTERTPAWRQIGCLKLSETLCCWRCNRSR